MTVESSGSLGPLSSIAMPSSARANGALAVMDWLRGDLAGPLIRESAKTLGAMAGLYREQPTDPDAVAYRVKWMQPVEPGTVGALFWGVTALESGKVGEEYYMTHGHFHADPSRAEFYATASGHGQLLLMDRGRQTAVHEMFPGSVHAIDGRLAHRVVNVGEEPLVFWACWPADAGYDYEAIAREGFSIRVLDRGGRPVLVDGGRE